MMLLPAKMNSFNGKQGQVPGWMTIVGTFFFFFPKREGEPFVNPHVWCVADDSFAGCHCPAELSFVQEISKPIGS